MTENKIADTLEELREEIDRLDTNNQTAKTKLEDLVTQLESRLGAPVEREDEHYLIDDMKEVISQFEVEHPRITGILNDLMVTLSNLGI